MEELTREYLEGIKRKELLALCKKYGIKCTGKNAELVEKLQSQIQQSHKHCDERESPKEETAERQESPLVKIKELESKKEQEEMVPTSQINGDQQTLTPRNSLSKQTTTLDPTTLMSAVEMMPIMTNPITSLKPFTKARIISKPFTSTSTSTSASASASTTTVKSITKDKNQTKPKFDLKESLKRPLSYKPHTGPLKPFKLP